MKTITILGDSISMVRPKKNIYLKDIYSYKLQQRLNKEYYVINNSIRGSHAKIQKNKLEDTALYNKSEIYIVFFGIVDCFPRLFSIKEKRILKLLNKIKLSFFSKKIIDFKSNHRYFFTKHFRKTYTTQNEFMHTYKYIVDKLKDYEENKKIILVNIPSPNKNAKKRNYNVNKNICEYNEIINKISSDFSNVEMLDFYKITKNSPELLLEDGIHINKQGHKLISEILYSRIISK